jgi:hypothetical protein
MLCDGPLYTLVYSTALLAVTSLFRFTGGSARYAAPPSDSISMLLHITTWLETYPKHNSCLKHLMHLDQKKNQSFIIYESLYNGAAISRDGFIAALLAPFNTGAMFSGASLTLCMSARAVCNEPHIH